MLTRYKAVIWQSGLVSVLWLWSVTSLFGATIALIPGQGNLAPAQDRFALLEIQLSKEASFTMVEREKINRILNEQKLTAEGWQNATNTLRLGQLLSADLFVFVEKLPSATKPGAWRIQAVESNNGLILCSKVDAATNLVQHASLVREIIALAVAKASVATERRHLISLLGVKSEEPGRALEPMATALGMVLAEDINANPNFVLLDREHLQHLSYEQRLTDKTVALKAATSVLELGLKHHVDTNQLTVNVVFRTLVDGKTMRLQIVVPADNFSALREKVDKAICRTFENVPGAKKTYSSREEAIMFCRRAQVLMTFGLGEEASRAAEAAVALYPHPNICKATTQVWGDYRSALVSGIIKMRMNGRLLQRGEQGYQDYPTDVKVRIFKSMLREYELEDIGREFVIRHPSEAEEKLVPVNFMAVNTRGFEILVHSEEVEARETRQELFEKTILRHRKKLKEYESRWNETDFETEPTRHAQYLWITEIQRGLSYMGTWAPDVIQWAKHFQEVVNQATHPPGEIEERFQKESSRIWSGFVERMARFEDKTVEERAFVRKTLENMEPKTNIVCQFAMRCALFSMSKSDKTANSQRLADARELLDYFIRQLPITHSARQAQNDYYYPSGIVGSALRFIPDTKERLRTGLAIIEPIIGAKDWPRLQNWQDAFNACVEVMAPQERKEFAQLLKAAIPDEEIRLSLPLNNIIRQFLQNESPEFSKDTSDWEYFEIEPFLTGELPQGDILTATRSDRGICFVWIKEIDPNQALFTVTESSLAGGKLRVIGSTAFSTRKTPFKAESGWPFSTNRFPSRPSPSSRRCAIVAGSGNAYLASQYGGFAVFSPAGCKVFTRTNGLPVEEIFSLAMAGNRVYIGANGLFEFDLQTEMFREIASNFSIDDRTPLNGGNYYEITNLQWDIRAKQIYLDISVRLGLRVEESRRWRYAPDTGEFKQVDLALNRPPRPRLGDMEFAGRDGLQIYKASIQRPDLPPPRPIKTITRFPDGRFLTSVSAICQLDNKVLFTTPQEAWTIRMKSKVILK